MSTRLQTSFRRANLKTLGVFLCLLLAFFSVENKLSMYSRQSDVRAVAATKVQRPTSAAVATTAAGDLGLAALLTVILLTALPPALRVVHRRRLSGMLPALTAWYSPPIAVRPPPTL